MTVRHPGISPTNDLVAKKIFSNPEITCQFIRDMLDLPAKNVTILEGSNIHVLPSLPYSAQDFYTSIDVLAELDNGTQVIIEIQVHHQNFFINRLWAYLCSQVNQNLEKIRQREGDTHQSYKHIAPVYAIAIVDSNYFSDDLAFHSFSMREDTTGEVLTITNNGQENHLVKMAFLELKKDNGGNDANTPAAKTVVDPAKGVDEEAKKAIADKVKAVNPDSTVVVDDQGNATVTKGDGTVLNIPASDLVISAGNLADEAKKAKVKTPAFRTLVGNKENLKDFEKEAIKKAIEAVNLEGTTVVVDDKGNATVTLPDGSTATISKEQLVKDKEAVSKSKHGGDNLDIDLSKVEVADLANITPEEKAKFQFKVLGAITNVEKFDLDAYIKSTDKDGNTVYTSKDSKVKITIDKDGNATVEKDGKKELAINIDKAGNVTIVTKEGQVLAIPRDDAFKQRPYVPSNGGGNNSGNGNGTSGNNGATNTDAKVDKAKLEGAIHQLDELIIKESAKLDAETAKEANDLLADAKKVFANADATQAEVDAMVKRIEDFMAKVASSTDHATPATAQAASNASQEAAENARKAAKELPNTGTADSVAFMVAAAASAVLGIGLAVRRRKEDEEA